MSHVRIAVIGGGITGRLVQFQIPDAVVYDWKTEPRSRVLTRDNGANYLWEPIPGIPCREFTVITHIDGKPATRLSASRYKAKIGKLDDMNFDWERQFRLEMPGYDFLELPPSSITYGHRVEFIDPHQRSILFANNVHTTYDYLVSTIPLYALLSLLQWRQPVGELKYRPIFNKQMGRPPDAPFPIETMYVNYLSDPTVPPYRYCDRDGARHWESIEPFAGAGVRRLAPGKIYAHDEVPDILDRLAHFKIRTFGRYASWNPDELIHETWARIHNWRKTLP